MTKKSCVGMSYKLCPACLDRHDETVLIDRRLKDSLDYDNFTGWAMCPVHEKMREKYVILVECETAPAGDNPLVSAKRTGQLAFVKRDVWEGVFNSEMPKAMAWVPVGVIQSLQDRMPTADQTNVTRASNEDNADKTNSVGPQGSHQEGSATSESEGPGSDQGDAGSQGDGSPDGEPAAR